MVLLPEPLRPVNHNVAPFCFSKAARSSRVTCPSCQVMFVALISAIRRTTPADVRRPRRRPGPDALVLLTARTKASGGAGVATDPEINRLLGHAGDERLALEGRTILNNHLE